MTLGWTYSNCPT